MTWRSYRIRDFVMLAALLVVTFGVGPALGDSRIGAPQTNARAAVLDADGASGNLFALIRWVDGWNLFLSTDGGNSWAEVDAYTANITMLDAGMTVIDGWVYVGYLDRTFDDRVFLRRYTAADGGADASYGVGGTYTVLDVFPALLSEIEIDSNAVLWDRTVYVAAIDSLNRVHWMWDAADDGTTFTVGETNADDAAAGLDMEYNPVQQSPTQVISYIATDDDVNLLYYNGALWGNVRAFAGYSGVNNRTSVGLSGDTVIIAHEASTADGTSAAYHVSYNKGVTWISGNLASPSPTVGAFTEVTLTGRGGLGFSVVFSHDDEPDQVWWRHHDGYGTGAWDDGSAVINDIPVATAAELEIQWLAPVSSFGVIYISQGPDFIPYFDLVGGELLFADGFESGNTSAWDGTS